MAETYLPLVRGPVEECLGQAGPVPGEPAAGGATLPGGASPLLAAAAALVAPAQAALAQEAAAAGLRLSAADLNSSNRADMLRVLNELGGARLLDAAERLTITQAVAFWEILRLLGEDGQDLATRGGGHG
jgi:hypothetical protein